MSGAEPVTVTALLACHNRREVTLRCLRSLFRTKPAGMLLTAVVVDDGSTDGTAAAIGELGLPITVVRGPGDWFWSRAMAQGEVVAERMDPDVIIWINDDVELDIGAMMQVMAGLSAHPDAVLVGAMRAVEKEKLTYSGFNWTDRGVSVIQRLSPDCTYRPVEAFHGNFVAIPRSARRAVGPMDGRWPHNFGDLDYARRLNAAGVPILLMPLLVGSCNGHVVAYLDPDRSPWGRLWAALGRKGWPIRAQIRYYRRHRIPGAMRQIWMPYRSAFKGPAPKESANSQEPADE